MKKNSYYLVSLENNNTSAFISSSQQLAIGIELNTRDDVRYKHSCILYTWTQLHDIMSLYSVKTYTLHFTNTK